MKFPSRFFDAVVGDALEKGQLDIEIRCLGKRHGRDPRWPEQFWFRSLKEFEKEWSEIEDRNLEGFDIHFTVLARRREIYGKSEHPLPEPLIVAAIWADLDVGKGKPYERKVDALHRIQRAGPVPNIIVESGAGLHPYWLVKVREVSKDRLERLLRRVSEKLGGDNGAARANRLMRVPNTYNWKYGKHGKRVRIRYLSKTRYRLSKLERLWKVKEGSDRNPPHKNDRARFSNFFAQHLSGFVMRGNEGAALCPFHNDRSPSFSVNLNTGLWKCWGRDCGAKGNLQQFCKRLKIPDPQGSEPKTLPRTTQYWFEGHQICRAGREGSAIPLCNFEARVKQEIILDDGLETARALVIKGCLHTGERLPTARVPAARFGAMNWIIEHWGSRAIVAAGFSRRDQLREAIQRISPKPKQRHVFTHTGWREINGKWAFITQSGAIGGKHIHVDLDSELARYSLPLIPERPDKAMRASLRLLELAPLTVTLPLWAAMFRAPLGGVLPSNLTVWI